MRTRRRNSLAQRSTRPGGEPNLIQTNVHSDQVLGLGKVAQGGSNLTLSGSAGQANVLKINCFSKRQG